jgi:hypothetical protein
MQFGGWRRYKWRGTNRPNRVRKGQSLGLESFSSRVTLGGTSTDEVFFAQFQERLGFGFRDLKLFMGFQ